MLNKGYILLKSSIRKAAGIFPAVFHYDDPFFILTIRFL